MATHWLTSVFTCSIESSYKGDIKPAEGGFLIEPINMKQREMCTGTVTEDKKLAKPDTTLVSVETSKHPRQKAKKKITSESKVKLPVCGPPKQESQVRYIVVQPANPNKTYLNTTQTNRRVGDALHITPIKPADQKKKLKIPPKKAPDPVKLDPLESCIVRKKTFILPPSLSSSNSGSYQSKNRNKFDNYILQGIPVPTSTKNPLSTKPKGVRIGLSGAPVNIFQPKSKSSSRKHVTTPIGYSRPHHPATLNDKFPRVTTPINPLRGAPNDNFLVNMLNNLG